MMPSDVAAAEAGISDNPTDAWWLKRWSSWLATVGAVALAFFGVLGVAFNIITFSLMSAIASGIQIIAAAIILAIEGSAFVSFLTFAKPIGLYFEGRPLYVKAAVYAALTVAPMLLGPSGVSVMLGFITSAAITAIYAMILIGRKAPIDDMRAAAGQPKI